MTSPVDAAAADLPASCAAALASIPAGRWAVGVSGGADSVALLLLLRSRPDLFIHVVHLDHETRNGASAADAAFVRDLAAKLGLPCTVAIRSTVESKLDVLEPNISSRFRAARLALYRRAVAEHDLAGVILAHHAEDQAETLLQRLLRGSGPAGLSGMSPDTRLTGLRILRPLLEVRRDELRGFLHARDQPWREDTSNASDAYLRNRLRRVLESRPRLIAALLRVGKSCRELRAWLHAHAPPAGAELHLTQLLALPLPLQRELARRWLTSVGVPEDRLDPGVLHRLIKMADDAASPARQHFPGEVLVCRRRGALHALREAN